jgi:hypothetical protein
MGAFTQKSPGISPFHFPHLGDKKPERRIITFNSASQIRVMKARNLSDSRRLSTGFLASRFLFRIAENFVKFISVRQSRKKILREFLMPDFPINKGNSSYSSPRPAISSSSNPK